MSQILTLRPARTEDQEFLYRLFCSVHSEKLQLVSLNPEEKNRLIELMYQGFTRHHSTLALAPATVRRSNQAMAGARGCPCESIGTRSAENQGGATMTSTLASLRAWLSSGGGEASVTKVLIALSGAIWAKA
jgi:hypothetical protein